MLAQPDQGLTPCFVLTALRQWWKVALPVALLLLPRAARLCTCSSSRSTRRPRGSRSTNERRIRRSSRKEDGRSKLFFNTQIETIRSPLVLGPVLKIPEIAECAGDFQTG